MNIARSVVGLLALAISFQAFAGLDGKQVKVTAGPNGASNAVVTIPTDEAEAPAIILEAGDEKNYASFRNGELIFIVDELKAGESRTYTISTSEEAPKPGVRIDPSGLERAAIITIDGDHFTSVHYNTDRPVFKEDDYKKPFLWPLHSAGGTPVTRAWPMGEREMTRDHPHHKSMWGSYGDINGSDFWGEGEESGRQIVNKIDFASGAAMGWVRLEIILHAYGGMADGDDAGDKRGEAIMTEVREYRFYNTPEEGRYIDQTSTFTADRGDVKFGDTKEGGLMAFRVRDIMTEKKGGTITMTDNRTGHSNVWGKISPWCDYSGELGDAGVHGIAVFDHPENLRYPTRWHVRDYGLMGPNCFGLRHFTANEEERQRGDFEMKEGESITFNYRAYIHSGDVNDAKVADRFANYATPPKAEWVK